ncbi:hypothetical protein CORC01_13408 [Colletotrichum orchidophilum]|uniref:Uncharacterized protein n=1 Tax=Colletotrichum orchidophilum TaxID=1209926 RepID=A0A1G4AQD5_9PEZI|nr:uncharacterized protein CORC01_13408 [Colletotrichum orchidophilum]OHE91293.1 hypothetical protein CORC01_13408 [Colletotrichum orchidophilum]
MCYQVYTHTMSCDIRPTITSIKTLYINPYQTPPRCPCKHPSPPNNHSSSRHPFSSSTPSNSRPCASHGCCSLNIILYRCPAYCRQPTEYHNYMEDKHQRHPSSRSRPYSSYSYSYTHEQIYVYASPLPPSSPPPPAQRPRWRTIRVFDRDPDFHALESPDLRFGISELVDIGRILIHAFPELDKARLRRDRERRRHDAAHGTRCERGSRGGWERECSWTRRIAEMALEVDNLKLSMEILDDCWEKYIALLRKYEGLGQRRVSGLVEDRGRRRRRNVGVEVEAEEEERPVKKERPLTYVSQESWVRKKRGGAVKKDRDCYRESEKAYRPEPDAAKRRSVRFADDVGGGRGYYDESEWSRRWSVY